VTALIEELLEIVLLQVDEGRHLVPALRQQVELVEQLLVMEDLAQLPGHSLGERPLADPEPVQDLQGTLGVAQAPRALAELGLAVDHDAGNAPDPEVRR
jgi:hypothetical protein